METSATLDAAGHFGGVDGLEEESALQEFGDQQSGESGEGEEGGEGDGKAGGDEAREWDFSKRAALEGEKNLKSSSVPAGVMRATISPRVSVSAPALPCELTKPSTPPMPWAAP